MFSSPYISTVIILDIKKSPFYPPKEDERTSASAVPPSLDVYTSHFYFITLKVDAYVFT